MDIKEAAFEYFIDSLINWYKSLKDDEYYLASFTKLKLIKLLFFASAVNAKDGNYGLLHKFDKFVAMTFGPVESDVLNLINNSNTGKYKISDKALIVLQDNETNEIDVGTKKLIDEAITSLKKINPDLILYNAFDLVDLSHRWSCWQITFKYAQDQNKGSLLIPNELIVQSDKYYTI